MADFDINVRSPDDGHEAIRVAVVEAIEGLGYNADDIGMLLSLADTLFSLLDAVTARVDVLEIP